MSVGLSGDVTVIMRLVCEQIDNYRTVLRFSLVSKDMREAAREALGQIARSFEMVRWLSSVQPAGYFLPNPYFHFSLHPVSWPRSPHVWFAYIEYGSDTAWKCSILVNPLRGVELIARRARMEETDGFKFYEFSMRKWITSLEFLREAVLRRWPSWLMSGLSVRFDVCFREEDRRVLNHRGLIEPAVLAWLSARRSAVRDVYGRFMTRPNDDGTSWAFIREFEDGRAVSGVLVFKEHKAMDLLYYYNRALLPDDHNWAITGRREAMPQTVAHLKWLQDMSERTWKGVEWAVEIHAKDTKDRPRYNWKNRWN